MRISAKGRYALAATIHLAQKYDSGEYTTVLSISERFGISKIYLEQVFSLLSEAISLILSKARRAATSWRARQKTSAYTTSSRCRTDAV
jgi:hypothetical protein